MDPAEREIKRLSEEIVCIRTKIDELFEKLQQCSDQALEAKLQQQVGMLELEKTKLLDCRTELQKRLTGMQTECLPVMPVLFHAC